jgi:hypothetical protein
MEGTTHILELVKKEIIEIEESIVYHKNKLIILELKLEDLQHREQNLINYLNS